MAVRKYSRKREAILSCVRSTHSHPTAEWVYHQLKPALPDLSLGTVYRNLAMFKREGVICSVGIVDGMERFDGNVLPHAHFICTHCNGVYDLEGVAPPQELMRQVTCGTASQCLLTFTGLCNHCVHPDAEA